MAARCPQLASTSSAMSPAKFFLHSPNSDAGDSSEEEGDTLFTPPSLGHPSAMFSQMNSQFTFRYPAESSTLEIPVAQEQTRPSRPLSPVAPVFTPAAKLKQPQQHSYERPISGPSPALDLANASLEFDPFAASFSSYCDPQTSPLKQPSTGRDRPSLSRSPVTDYRLVTKARVYSPRFPNDHYLDSAFVRAFQLEDELGSGGYGFVMTARHRTEGYEVAVKFIIKAKVPENSWMDDEILGRVPTEILLLSLINHENIVKCIDVYEDELYFYLVRERIR
ncbi:kinase-like protein [Gloeophyllum trabeum ATCC 11539]|uniref:Kinase-like protein n=1 Tax=Gloeophyllum trabeum (strain ATCC 11539 / FP-39264 / Madison 617) TaxID=670483 RepID=S7RR21_GLOTA|nr:kinase-like protein [Gloeophyllum trabeum ATCC 11539]EPQ57030.1 kinase-like protein [Gloeophyllum trabeum ATCC 11539]